MIVAIEVLFELQVPPEDELYSGLVLLTQTVFAPVIDPGNGFTETNLVAKHPVELRIYETVDVPADSPVTIPVAEPILAIAVNELVQVPPEVALVNVVLAPAQTAEDPAIAAGEELTVIVAVEVQPVGKVYVITAVPDETPFRIPVVLPIVAIDVLLLLHDPPVVVFVSVVFVPAQTDKVPDIAAGSGFVTTVTELPEEQPPFVAVTVYTLSPITVGVIVVDEQVVQEIPDAPPTPLQE